MLGSHRSTVLLLCAWMSACSLVTDFDRSKIDRTPDGDGGVGGDGSVPDMDAGMDGGGRGPDAAVDAGGRMDAAPDSATPPECTRNSDCGDNELCCDEMCVAATFEGGCESCGTPCDGKVALACMNRTCVCEPGSGAACSGEGEEQFCDGELDTPECVECRGDSDCPTARPQCVSGSCEECDPTNGNSGCMNPEPICDPATRTCVGCDQTHACSEDLTCVSGSCYGCNPANNAGCDPDSGTPICQSNGSGLNECVACHVAGSGDTACQSLPADQRQCLTTGECAQCDTNGNAGCNPNSGTPICGTSTNTCRPCMTGDCSGSTPYCAINGALQGRCVECVSNTQCGNDACVNGSCVDCMNDGQCAGHPAGGQCVGGDCRACDPAGDAGCSGAMPQCNPATFTCVQCLSNADCGGTTPICSGSNQCVACASNAQCMGSPAGSQCAASGACVQCLSNADCGGATPICSGSNQCVACTSNPQCTGNPAGSQCAASGACVECTSHADCSGTRPICGASNQCVACSAGAQCASKNAATPQCADSGACVECTADTQCSNPEPLCENNACVPCNAVGVTNADTRCGSGLQCVTTGSSAGECRGCDPADDSGCSGTNDQCNPSNFTCVDCIGGAGCPSGQVCLSGDNSCVECNNDTDCTAAGASQCVSNTCRACDPADDAGCSVGQTCSASFQCVSSGTPDAGP